MGEDRQALLDIALGSPDSLKLDKSEVFLPFQNHEAAQVRALGQEISKQVPARAREEQWCAEEQQ